MTEPTEHIHHAHTNVMGALTRKLGPLPGWAWVALAVAGYMVYRHYGAGRAPAVPPVDSSTGDSAGDSGQVASVGDGPGGGMLTASPGSGLSAAPSDAAWGQSAAGQLIANGANPSDVNNAINDYLNGNPLTAAERQIINQVLQQSGEPPEGVLPVISAPVPPPKSKPPTGTPIHKPKPKPKPPAHKPEPKPAPVHHVAPKPKPKPPAHKTYTVRSGDSLYSIASHYYGNGNEYEKIYKANKSTIGNNPSLIKPGQKLVIPK